MLVVTLTVPEPDAELAADRLWGVGARAVEERSLSGGRVELRTSLGDDLEVARARLGSIPDGWLLGSESVDETPAETWREFARPVVVSDQLVIRPAWWSEPVVTDGLVVAIEPGGSFGLGDHPTTRLSAAVVDELVRPGDCVLDVGCGSGVLAIIAARRGAGEVVATDISDDARLATEHNAASNDVAGAIAASTDELGDIDGTFDLVVANILAPTLVALSADLVRLTRQEGTLVISGVLEGGYDRVVAALAPLVVVDERMSDGWAAVVLRHRSAG